MPLNRMAKELLAGRDKSSAWLFESERAEHRKRLSLSQAVHRARDHFGIPAFGPHDLRRTAASHIAALGTPQFVVERLLNHTDQSVTASYDRYEYSKEKRQALEQWDRLLRRILSVEKAKVVTIA